MKKLFLISIIGFMNMGVWSLWLHAAINYYEYFPNVSSLYQSQRNWWTTPVWSQSKEIMTPEWCKKITGWYTDTKYFTPTQTWEEWNSFKRFPPAGTTIGECCVGNIWTSCSYQCYWKRSADWYNRPWNTNITTWHRWCNPSVTAIMPPSDWPGFPVLSYYCIWWSEPTPINPKNWFNTSLINWENCWSNPPVDGTYCDVTCWTTISWVVQCDWTCR